MVFAPSACDDVVSDEAEPVAGLASALKNDSLRSKRVGPPRS